MVLEEQKVMVTQERDTEELSMTKKESDPV